MGDRSDVVVDLWRVCVLRAITLAAKLCNDLLEFSLFMLKYDSFAL